MRRHREMAPQPVRPLARREFEAIRQLAYRAFGLDLQSGKEELVSARLQRLVSSGGFHSYHDYYCHVVEDATGESLSALIDALATTHTSFLRETDHFEFLRRAVAPTLARRRGVDVWSAACATGEEVWSLAFLLNEVLPGCAIRLVGTDISRKALDCCRRAVYSSDRVSGLPPLWIKAYMVPEGHPPVAYCVKSKIREQAVFRRLNLIEPWDSPARFPVIFCRNVMIYFDRITQERVLSTLTGHLDPGGYLFIGHADSLSGIDHRLQPMGPGVYRKPPARQGDLWAG